ncbi:MULTISPECIES: acyl-CoA dehydrogenase family protein [Streptomyces]|uniref:Acyl-CoA dehydrogenase n=1 Tax=Streptomyces tsukubensis (strain DSM 42081 / NBRC 108919 / NRRL 18488 / 9993) TaxID=1114943 RepID=I2NAF5_STRT9|nr:MULTISPECIES: acyl-CoA dehydrogenase [Streptomyces]AZK97801.1 acyl-CoA dehydrogenase [Streptomyces tsukubensis]EIF94002.1 acyl-CoA dehydrogenase [Streptomyces tsukubensis NRRL18488]MYS63225.1 acyl-CoA dehydrogenase [Streptomyces sp. SID5473]QKM66272.1 acyl-CoA dehydrogenase [Streptomyces tsukubensis NRRL18488]TAI45390.1 acyl-CoA dehydrogenase [Streptomyces tsukubensis]
MAIDFTLTPEQLVLRARARDFARRSLSGVGPATRLLTDPEERWQATRPVYEQAVAEGWLRRILPEPLGGEGRGMVDLALVAEEFVAVDANVSLTLFAVTLGLTPLMAAGSPEQLKEHFGRFLEPAGAPLAAFAFSEPGGIANYDAPAPAEGVRTTAVLDERTGEWVINGSKRWVSSAGGWDGQGPDLLAVVCRTSTTAAPGEALSVILVPGPVAGLTLDNSLDLLGHRAHQTPTITLRDVRVPRGNVLGVPGAGRAVVAGSFVPTAALVGVFALAKMRAAFDFALGFAKRERRAGAVPIIDHQAVGYALADAKSAMEAVRCLSWRACHALDTGSPAAAELALHAKVFGSETAVRVVTDLMRVVGMESYSHESPLAEILQDALAYPLFDGGNIGVRRRQLHAMLADPEYDAYATHEDPAR